MFAASENVRERRPGQEGRHPGTPGGTPLYQSPHGPRESFYNPADYGITHGLYEGNHAGILLPPSMGRVPFSDLSVNRPPPDAGPSSATAPAGRRKAPRLALTRSTLLAAERQTAWHDQLRYASASTGSPSVTSDEIDPGDSFSIVHLIPPANENDDGGAAEPSSEGWDRRMHDCFESREAFSKHITVWASKIMTMVRPTFLEEDEKGHWYCDVDFATGKTMDPVLFPTTRRDETPLDDAGAAERRRTQTAASVSRKYVLHLDKKPEQVPDTDQDHSGGGVRLHEDERQQGVRPEMGKVDPKDPKDPNNLASERPPSPVVKMEKPVSAAPAVSHVTAPPSLSYYMRRAEIKDLAGVLAIYNWEVTKGTQATDTDPLVAEDFAQILQTCRYCGLPFLVVVAAEQVVGFGFYSNSQPGLSRRMRKSGPWAAKANIYVEKNHRQRGVGSALLDRLLVFSSDKYAETAAKKNTTIPFLEMSTPPTDEYTREYLQVSVEILCGSPTGLAETWYRRILTGRFGFQSPGTFTHGVHWSQNGQRWLGRLVFRHECLQNTGSLQTSGNSQDGKEKEVAPEGKPRESIEDGSTGGNATANGIGDQQGPREAWVPSTPQGGRTNFW